MNKIEELTPEQEALLDVYADRWTAIGHCTDPADRPEAEAAIDDVYRVAGMKPPAQKIWVGSPMALGAAEAEAAKSASMSPERRGDSQYIYGSHEAGWLSRYAYFREVLGLENETEEVVPLMRLAKSCGWCLPTEGRVIMSERHNVLKLDSEGLAHCLDGPAIAYPDGRGVYCVRGLNVPSEWVINRATLDVRIALEHPNLEQRSAAAQIIGWDRVLMELRPRVVDVETSPEYDYGRLLAVDLPEQPDQRFLEVLCPTGRKMVIRVPPEMKTAREANAWTYPLGIDPSEFKPEGRT